MIAWAVALVALALAALGGLLLLRGRPPSRSLVRRARVPLAAPPRTPLGELPLPPRSRVRAPRADVPAFEPIAPEAVDLALLGLSDDRAELELELSRRVRARLAKRPRGR